MKFLYFAYGSNLLSKRMHINCPSAEKKAVACLKKYCLAFAGFGSRWKGACATITENENGVVWGVVWEIAKDQEKLLDRQEAGYNPITVTVENTSGRQYVCKSYQMKVDTSQINALPSAVYKGVILHGAEEHNLPDHYLSYLKCVEDNGYNGPVDVLV